MSKRVTISDVARTAGVSIATVSRVLNGNDSVNPELAARVQEAVAKLDFRPNPAAQGLASGAYRTIGVIVPDLGNPYFSDILQAIVTHASADSYRIVVSDTQGDPNEELTACRQFLPYVDGIVAVSPRMSQPDLHTLAGLGVPTVLVNRRDTDVPLPSVAVDNRAATLAMCRHLADLGHRRIAYVSGPPTSWQNAERIHGINDAANLGIMAAVVPAWDNVAGGYDATEAALATDPTAIITYNDLAAVGVLERLRQLGLAVPTDISVAGFDDIEIARYLHPRLTTVVNPKAEVGAAAWEALSRRIKHDEVSSPDLIKCHLVARDSTGPVRA